MTSKLEIEERGPIREFRLHRPEVHNAFDEELIGALQTAFDQAERDVSEGADLRGILLSGAGKSFCAGADLNYMRAIAGFGRAENERDAMRLSRMFLAIRRCPVYVVARIQGAALGGGTGLVAAADLAVAGAGTRFGFTEVRLGIVPAVISPFVLDRIGPARGRALFPTGERFGAEEALRIGLVDRVVPDDALDGAVGSVLGELLQAGPGAAREAKRLATSVGRALPLSLEPDGAVFGETAEWIARLRAGEEGQEGMSAFLGKRRPHWFREMPEGEGKDPES